MIKICNTNKSLNTAILAGLISTSAAFAGETTMVASKEVMKPEPAAVERLITGDLGAAVVSKYFSRGINNGDQGVIVQPYADLYFKLYSGEGFINSITLNASIWSSLHEQVLGNSSGTTKHWQEFDYTPGIAIGFAKNFTLTLSYFEFDYPSDISNPQRSVNGNLAFNDTDLLGDFALHPHIAVLAELSGAPAGINPGGWYGEFGIAPSHTFGPVTLTVPLNVGVGYENFYSSTDDGLTYGYFSGGLTAAVPLAFIPAGYGSWTFTAGATYYNLGSENKTLNNGEKNDYVFSGAIGLTF